MAPQDRSSIHLNDFIRNDAGEFQVSKGHGLCLRLHSADGSVSISVPEDAHYPEIHPHCYAPAALDDVHLLHGGGSGTAVFHGRRPGGPPLGAGSLVMKHGNAKDTGEVFSLARIHQQLLERGSALDAQAMRERIPRFVMLYLSPYHLRDRGTEAWTIRSSQVWKSDTNLLQSLSVPFLYPTWEQPALASITEKSAPTETFDPTETLSPQNTRDIYRTTRRNIEVFSPRKRSDQRQQIGFRTIRIRRAPNSDRVEIIVCLRSVVINIPEKFLIQDCNNNDDSNNGSIRIAKGIQFLEQLEEELVTCQTEQNWKVTLAQSTIGGPHPQNGANVLTSFQLDHAGLQTELVDSMIAVMGHLRNLTWPQERAGARTAVLKEVEQLRKTQDVTAVSDTADGFVGSAIKKNFDPTAGRLAKMREFGVRFRAGDMYVTEAEEFPASFLALLLQKGTPMSAVFVDPPAHDDALDQIESKWLPLLEHAASIELPSASECIWTCGLTDAGLHNTFFSKERGLELFDLGAPVTMPQPAFLTKFLMSFFHTAGMEENGSGSWVNRFFVVDDKLALTPATIKLIPYLDRCFERVLDKLVEQLFNNDQSARQLLIMYVVLQILSDAAFCLGRWEKKGGGTQRHGETGVSLEKWLWRSIWDIYIASKVYNAYLVGGRRKLNS